MKSIFGLAALAVLLAAPGARAGDVAVEALVRQFGVAFNAGDMKAAKALHVAAPTIIDEVAPHYWSGPGAFDSWSADLDRSEAAEGKTGGEVVLSVPSREVVSAESAYVVVPATFSFKQKGVAVREVAQMTFVLSREASGWKIRSWVWTGAEGVPVTAR